MSLSTSFPSCAPVRREKYYCALKDLMHQSHLRVKNRAASGWSAENLQSICATKLTTDLMRSETPTTSRADGVWLQSSLFSGNVLIWSAGFCVESECYCMDFVQFLLILFEFLKMWF